MITNPLSPYFSTTIYKSMKWIVITSPETISGEAIFIDKMFWHGLDLLHLRKPGASVETYRELLKSIPAEWHSRIVLHEHFYLTTEFALHGIHLNRRCAQVPEGFGGSISCACHSLTEVCAKKPLCQYVFLSPIFNSISKVGYEAAFSDADLQQAAADGIIDNKVIALGGVTAANISQLQRMHFGGAAFLGDIWNRINQPQFDAYLKQVRDVLG